MSIIIASLQPHNERGKVVGRCKCGSMVFEKEAHYLGHDVVCPGCWYGGTSTRNVIPIHKNGKRPLRGTKIA